jgi:hypothetical protein
MQGTEIVDVLTRDKLLFHIPYFFLQLLYCVNDFILTRGIDLRFAVFIFFYELERLYSSLIIHIVRYLSRSMCSTLRREIEESYIVPEYTSTFLQKIQIILSW